MTQGIISLGQRTASSALLLRASWRSKICESLPSARPAFSVGHFDPLVLLRVKSSAGWQRLISNRPWSVTDGIRLSSWQPDFYDSVSCRVTDRTGVIKMRTPVASLRTKSSYHFDNLILIRLKSSYGKRNLISEILPNSHFEDLGAGNLSVTVFWYFPKWEAPLY